MSKFRDFVIVCFARQNISSKKFSKAALRRNTFKVYTKTPKEQPELLKYGRRATAIDAAFYKACFKICCSCYPKCSKEWPALFRSTLRFFVNLNRIILKRKLQSTF